MPQVTIWLPDALYRQVQQRRGTAHEVNVSALATRAVRDHLRYGPEAEAQMRALAADLETPDNRQLLSEWEATAADGLEEAVGDEPAAQPDGEAGGDS